MSAYSFVSAHHTFLFPPDTVKQWQTIHPDRPAIQQTTQQHIHLAHCLLSDQTRNLVHQLSTELRSKQLQFLNLRTIGRVESLLNLPVLRYTVEDHCIIYRPIVLYSQGHFVRTWLPPRLVQFLTTHPLLQKSLLRNLVLLSFPV